MTSLSIKTATSGNHYLCGREAPGTALTLLARVSYGSFTSRPDPVRRAWLAVEAKQGFVRLQDAPAPAPVRSLATRNGFQAPAYTPAAPRMAARAEKPSQGWVDRTLALFGWRKSA